VPHSTSFLITSKSPLWKPSISHSQGPYRLDKNSPSTMLCSHRPLSTRLHTTKGELGRPHLLNDRLASTRKLLSLRFLSKTSKRDKNDPQLAIYEISRDALLHESENSACPMGCGMDEIAMRHLDGTTLPASDLRSINRWMSHQNTAPPIQLAIMCSLKAWISDEPILQFDGDSSDKLDRITALAHAEQSLIGWTQAFKGRSSMKWTTAQGMWYDHMLHNPQSG